MSQIRGASSEGDYYNSEYVIFIVFYFLFFLCSPIYSTKTVKNTR